MNTHCEVYQKALKTWGVDNQINQCIEEMAELMKALNKYRRNCTYCEMQDTGNAFRGDIIEEIADVYQMLEQMMIAFGVTERELQENTDRSFRKMCRELEEV